MAEDEKFKDDEQIDTAVHEHPHGHKHGHIHEHAHIHTNKKAVLRRLARADGHLQSVMRMIEDNRDCSEVLIQLAAVKSAITNAGKVLLRDHINECIKEAVLHGDTRELEELNRAIDQFVK